MKDQSFLLLFCILVLFSVGQVSNEISTNSKGAKEGSFQRAARNVAQVIDKGIVYVVSSQCERVQKVFQMSYEQLKGKKEPDVNHLTLFCKSRLFTKIFNMTEAVDSLWNMHKVELDQRLIIFLHGFTDNPTKSTFTHIAKSFLDRDDITVIALDASALIGWLYFRSSVYVRFIGYKLAEILAAIVQQGQDPSLIHVIGHSLGAHIAGFAGKTFQELTGKRIGRISGLDPAGPCFSHADPELRLKHTDADYVDVMHTGSDIFGIKEPVGHKDYYPNSGTLQPNCILQSCSHSRTWFLFGESLDNPEAFPAVRCKDWDAFKNGQCDSEISYMGYPSKPGEDGMYFLQTGGTYPFGLGMEGIKYRKNR